MKFGKQLHQLQVAKWRGSYVSYKKLKRVLNQLYDADGTQKESRASLEDGTLAAFYEIIEADLRRIRALSIQELTDIETRLDKLRGQASSPRFRRKNFESDGPSWALATDDAKRREREIESLYLLCTQLRSFHQINREGLRKIVKKLDRGLGMSDSDASHQKALLSRIDSEPTWASDAPAVLEAIATIERFCNPAQISDLRAMAKAEQERTSNDSGPKLWAILCALAAGGLVAVLPLQMEIHAHRCLVMITIITTSFATAALPYFVTALLAPVLTVVLKVLPHHVAATPAKAVQTTFQHMFNSCCLLLLAGLTAASIVARCQLESWLSAWFVRQLGSHPYTLLFTMMQVALLSSMVLSNVVSPVLLFALVQPILAEVPTTSRYARSMMIGMGFASNLGGWLSPIASVTNIMAAGALSRHDLKIDFIEWVAMALPLAEVGLLAIFATVLLLIRHDGENDDPEVLPPLGGAPASLELSVPKQLMLASVVLTFVGWLLVSSVPAIGFVFGDTATVGLLLMLVAYGSGFLGVSDFNSQSWHVVFLIAGGNVLGYATKASGLLRVIDGVFHSALAGSSTSPFVVLLRLTMIILPTSIVLGHATTAIMLMPLVVHIGDRLGYARLLTFCVSLANVAGLCVPSQSPVFACAEDDYGTRYVRVNDFITVGLVISVVGACIAITGGYGLATVVLGSDPTNATLLTWSPAAPPSAMWTMSATDSGTTGHALSSGALVPSDHL